MTAETLQDLVAVILIAILGPMAVIGWLGDREDRRRARERGE